VAALQRTPEWRRFRGRPRPNMLLILPKFPMLHSPNPAYYAQIMPNYAQLCRLISRRQAGELRLAYNAKSHAGMFSLALFRGADCFTYTQRHLTSRVAYGLPLRHLMREAGPRRATTSSASSSSCFSSSSSSSSTPCAHHPPRQGWRVFNTRGFRRDG